jgi:hypothetical protein
MALKDTVKDPLNWVLLILALAFGYYVAAIPYWQNYYLKTPQEMTMADYLANPSHPRPFMLRALGSPPSSIEVVLTDLTVAHIDSDSILLQSGDGAVTTPAVVETPAEPVEAAEDGVVAEILEVQSADETSEEFRLIFVDKAPPPNNELLIAGENMDLLEFSIGQQVSLQLHGLHESALGWIPLEVNLSREDEEYYTKEEIDELDRMRIQSNGNEVAIPYIDSAEMRFGAGDHGLGEPVTLETLSNDTTYIQTANRLQGPTESVDLYDVRLVGRAFEQLVPYFLVEDSEGRRARVTYQSRLLHEWYWALDRLQGQDVVVRGRLNQLAPADLRQLEADGNVQATLEGIALLSRDGAVVINLENPAGSLGRPVGQ